jgi:hypothetical protein
MDERAKGTSFAGLLFHDSTIYRRRNVTLRLMTDLLGLGLVATVAHSPLGARLRSECRPTMASAPPLPSGASPLTRWFAISCVRPSPVIANSPSPHVATNIVGFVTDHLPLSSRRKPAVPGGRLAGYWDGPRLQHSVESSKLETDCPW